MKMKHNKKRNTAFLYESLIKELTKSIVKKDNNKKDKILEVIKKYFSKNSPLKKELEVYKLVLEADKMSPKFSQRFLFEVKKDFDNLNRKQIFNLQSELISEINKNISNSMISNFVPNYKNIATIGQFFNSGHYDAQRRLLIEEKAIKILTAKNNNHEQPMKHIDNLTYNTFIKKFNESYNATLRTEQKNLLTNYIVSFSDNGLGLKSFLNEEIGRLKEQITSCLETDKIKNNEAYFENTNKILQKLDGYKNKPITEEIVKEVFYIQDLVQEVLK